MFDINLFKEKSLLYINKIDKYKLVIYSIFLFIYFFLYYAITVPQLFKDSKNNSLFDFFEKINKKLWYLIPLIFINIILFILFIGSNIYYIKNINTLTENKKLIYILISIFIISIMLYVDVITFGKYLIVVSNSIITKYIYLILSTRFYILFFILFIYNINDEKNIEFFISIEILILFLLEYIITTITNIKKLYYKIKNDDFSTLTINCLSNNIIEKYDDTNKNSDNIQINNRLDFFKFSKKF
jgi:hypothetical protein